MTKKAETRLAVPLRSRATATLRVMNVLRDFDKVSQRAILEASGVLCNVKLDVSEEPE